MNETSYEPKFPNDFLWGAAMSAHQVEGGNDNNWTRWESQNAQRLAAEASPLMDTGNGKGTLPSWDNIAAEAQNPNNYISGSAMGQWERWREDIDLAKDLGMNALRYSIEWSRVQPTADSFSQEVINHYAAMTSYCIENGITPVISLHHFTSPNWLGDPAAWERKDTVGLFTNYARRVVEELPTENVHWNVINEPNVYAGFGWIYGVWPPQKHNPVKYLAVAKNLVEAHKRGYDVIKEVSEDAQVSSAISYVDFEAKGGAASGLNNGIARLGRWLVNEWFQNATTDHQDYIALNHYWHCVVDKGMFKNDESEPRSDVGWYLNPSSMLSVLRTAAVHKKPIIITESGLADAQDSQREWFISKTLDSVRQAIGEGIDVRGYLHWSLLDNFEWDKGYWPKFGLVAVDRTTMQRTPRPSALAYKKLIESSREIGSR